jgi:hypothetical protein
MRAGDLEDDTRDGLYLLDVGYVAAPGALPPDESWSPKFQSDPFQVWQVRYHSPIVAAPRSAVVDSTAFSGRVRAMRLNRPADSAALIPVAEAANVNEPVIGADQSAVQLKVRDYQVELTRVRIDYEVSQPAVLQLSYSVYPYLQLYLDGRQTEYFATAFSLIGLVTPAGEHQIELRPVLSPLRRVSFVLDVAGLLGIALVAGWGRIGPMLARRRS